MKQALKIAVLFVAALPIFLRGQAMVAGNAFSSSSALSNTSSPGFAAASGNSVKAVYSRSGEIGWEATGGAGLGERSGFSFWNGGLHAGKVLTPVVGSGFFRGDFEYGVEVLAWQSYQPKFQRRSCSGTPGTPTQPYTCTTPYTVGGLFYGASITPIQMRWNFEHGGKLVPFVQAGGGVVWTNHKYPAVGTLDPLDTASNGPSGDTSVWNFTPQGGLGLHYFVHPQRSWDFGVNAVHLSSASLGDKNPGVNTAVMVTVGYSWWK